MIQFFSPLPIPISKMKNQASNEDIAAHNPYLVLSRYPSVMGTMKKLISILIILKTIDADKLTKT